MLPLYADQPDEMDRFGSILGLLSVETLDSRLGPSKDTKRIQAIKAKAGPPRWKTVEFYVYAVVFAIAVPLMVKAPIDASSARNPNYSLYSDLLEDGWMFGRKVDNSDAQYSGFRNNLPYLSAVILAHLCGRYLTRTKVSRFSYDIGFGIVYLSVLYGVSVFKILLLLTVNHKISQLDPKTGKIVTWLFAMVTLFANELLEGYPLAYIHPSLKFIDTNFGGLMPRWDVNFNISVLRLVSYNFDSYWARENKQSKAEKDEKATRLDEKQRVSLPLDSQDYNYRNYLAYALYAPLFIAGPILTFNDFVRQSQSPLPTINRRFVLRYVVRFLFCMLTMETLLHFTYVVAISQRRAWEGDSPFQISMIGLFNLNVIWLKLLLPWRLFRLWGLLDAIDAPENMVRCVNNNYSALSFWRSWHRSYNRWLTRYLYIPLGGSNRPIINSLVIFSFVAVWHDIQLHLLFWGWLVVLFILPEVGATMVVPRSKYGDKPFYRHLCALGAVVNIWMMMIANLIGFCVHLDGMQEMLHSMFRTVDGLKYVIVSTSCLFVGAQAMFEFREREHRKGIDLRC